MYAISNIHTLIATPTPVTCSYFINYLNTNTVHMFKCLSLINAITNEQPQYTIKKLNE